LIIIDYSQVALASIFMFEKDLTSDDVEKNKDIIRHAILTSILSNKKKFESEFGNDVVLACDGFNYWRKSEFAPYKAARKKARDDSKLDWKFVFEILSETREDLQKYFPYKVIRIERAEADDIIACLSKWTQTNDLMSEGIEPIPKRTLIISSDKDFKQLHKYSNIKQYSPMFKKYVEKPPKVLDFINEHIAKGDASDGIPNILSVDNSFIDKIRQKSMTKPRLEEFIKHGIGACKTEDEIRNWHRNELLISFDKIPIDIEESILKAFNEPAKGNKSEIFNYLVKNRMRLLLNDIDSF
jgi:hypothetical protein